MHNVQIDVYRVKSDGFYGELFRPVEDKYPGRALMDSLAKTLEFVSTW